MKLTIHTSGNALCKLIATLNPIHPKKPSDLVGLRGLHLRQKIKFLKNVSRETLIFTSLLLLTACGTSEPETKPLPTFDTRKPYESKLTKDPKCPLVDENGEYNMTGLSEDEVVHIMQWGCKNETPDGYKSPYKYRERTYGNDEYAEPVAASTASQEQPSNENLPGFDMFMTP